MFPHIKRIFFTCVDKTVIKFPKMAFFLEKCRINAKKWHKKLRKYMEITLET